MEMWWRMRCLSSRPFIILFEGVEMQVLVPGRWIENMSIEESKPEFTLNLWSVVSIGVEKRGGDGSEGTHLFNVKLKHRLCAWSDLLFTMVNNLV